MAVHFGVCMFSTAEGIPPAELAREVESRGFESLFLPEHTHMPTGRKSQRPSSSEELPNEYSRTLDPFVALGAAAAVTTTLKVATGICLVIQRDPIILAKEVATLDAMSGGRFLFGIGAGWNKEEIANHGTDFHHRFTLMRERVEAMKEIWHHDVASYHGTYVNFDNIWQWPKPVQEPHPPILIGGEAPRNLQRVARYADGWMPHPWEHTTFAPQLAALAEAAAAVGREPPPVTLYGVEPKPELVEQFREDGVARCVLRLPAAGRDEVMTVLEQHTALLRDVS